MFELSETVAEEQIVPLCCSLVGDELAYVTDKVSDAGTNLFGGFVYNFATRYAYVLESIKIMLRQGRRWMIKKVRMC